MWSSKRGGLVWVCVNAHPHLLWHGVGVGDLCHRRVGSGYLPLQRGEDLRRRAVHDQSRLDREYHVCLPTPHAAHLPCTLHAVPQSHCDSL